MFIAISNKKIDLVLCNIRLEIKWRSKKSRDRALNVRWRSRLEREVGAVTCYLLSIQSSKSLGGSLPCPQPTEGSGELRKLASGSGAKPQLQTIFGRFMRNIARFYGCFEAIAVHQQQGHIARNNCNKITFVRTRSLPNAITFSIQPTWRPLYEVMWRHRLRDQSIRHRPIPTGDPLKLILNLLTF